MIRLVVPGAVALCAAIACGGGSDGGGSGTGGADAACSRELGCQGCETCFARCYCELEAPEPCAIACATSPGSGGTGSGGTDPGAGGTMPGAGGTDPGAGGTAPGAGGSDPGAGGTMPGAGGTMPGAGGTGNPSDPFDAARDACVARINEYRATLGLPPYQRWTAQEACTDDQSRRDSETGQAHGNFGQCDESAQNTCPGYPSVGAVTSTCLDQMWAEGPPPVTPCTGACFQAHGHYLNMSSSRFTRVACGFHTMANGRVWANQNFK